MSRAGKVTRTGISALLAVLSAFSTPTVSTAGGPRPLSQVEDVVAPFLYPPFPGVTSESFLFDHSTPLNDPDLVNGEIVTYNGYLAVGDKNVSRLTRAA